MANTRILIKRSSVTATPTNGSLSAGELAYSYNSERLFLGTANGLNVQEIGGTYWVNHAKLAFDAANSAGSSATVGAAFDQANAAYSFANSVAIGANSYASSVGVAANAYAESVGAAANSYTSATYYAKSGGTVSGDVVITGNLTVSGETTYANTQHLFVGDNIFTLNADLPVGSAPSVDAGMEVNRGSSANVSLLWSEANDKWMFTNNGTTYVNIASNTDVEGAAAGANAYASSVGTSANAYAAAVGVSANSYASSVGVSANAYAALVAGYANTNASNASYISAGTLAVSYGGTGLNTVTTNGVLFGNGTGALQVTSAGLDGEVLQSDQGVPKFGQLDGGVF